MNGFVKYEYTSEEVKQNIKKNITALRKANKLKMRDVAAAINVNENTYRIWEDPKRSCPKPYDILKLATIYNVSCDFILGNSELKSNILTVNASNGYESEDEKVYLSSLDRYEKLLVMCSRRLSLEEKEKIGEEIYKFLDKKDKI